MLLAAIQTIDVRADTTGLSPDEWMHRYALKKELIAIYTNEECYWWQCGTQKWVLQGDANTVYFQAIANGW